MVIISKIGFKMFVSYSKLNCTYKLYTIQTKIVHLNLGKLIPLKLGRRGLVYQIKKEASLLKST